VTRESDERMCAGREFQLLGEDTQKAMNIYWGWAVWSGVFPSPVRFLPENGAFWLHFCHTRDFPSVLFIFAAQWKYRMKKAEKENWLRVKPNNIYLSTNSMCAILWQKLLTMY